MMGFKNVWSTDDNIDTPVSSSIAKSRISAVVGYRVFTVILNLRGRRMVKLLYDVHELT